MASAVLNGGSLGKEPALFITDLNQSPFYVGTVIRPGDFDRDDVLWLNTRHGSPLKTSEDLEELLHLVFPK